MSSGLNGPTPTPTTASFSPSSNLPFSKTKMPLPSLCNFFFVISLFLSLNPTLQIPLLAPVSKDDSTQLYTLTLYLKSPLQPTKLHLHLGSSLTWLLCDSTSYRRVPCNSSLCASFPSATCSNDACTLFPENPVTRNTVLGTALIDSLALPTYDGSHQSPLILISDFVFSCATAHLLQGLATNAAGLAALGRSNHSLPAQISTALSSSPHCFALCLPASSSRPGAAFFASTGTFLFSSKIDLTYTPLVVNPVADTVVTDNLQPSDEYFVNLTSIRINGKALPVNASILTVDQNGFGGTKISTAEPYTVLESSIYKLFVQLFVNESIAFNVTVTEAVEPFGVCYPASELTETRVGPAVPTVDLVMHSEDVFWRIFGGNSMVRIEKGGGDVWCLGFVDGGTRRRTPVVIGGHQLEDNLVQFDLEDNRFGFTSSLLLQGATCANLNITNFANHLK
ncbi:Basic 7S globulin [Spatholobus suberectus]|nr:Basic 7S globulin [Spatholobus suberectus]